MIVIYTSEGCSSCRKAKQYMKDNHLKFIEKNINKETLKEDEVRYLLKRTENGTQDLISSRSRIIKESEVDHIRSGPFHCRSSDDLKASDHRRWL